MHDQLRLVPSDGRLDARGHVWVFHRCFNVVPAGQATCIGRGAANPPILEFDPSGRLLRSAGAGLWAYPHGFTVDKDGNLWVTHVNDQDAILGMPARNAAGVIMGQEVLKSSPEGKVLTKDPRRASSTNRTTSTSAARAAGCTSPTARTAACRCLIRTAPSSRPGRSSASRVPSLKAFIPDPTDLDTVVAGTSASGIAADRMGSVFAADVGAHRLRKYVKVRQ